MTAAAPTSTSYPEFLQDGPRLGNQYSEDYFLQSILQRLVPNHVLQQAQPDLHKFGHRVASSLMVLADSMERNPPQLITYDSWGKRIDHIETCQAWKDNHVVSAEEGLIARGYAHHSKHVPNMKPNVPNYGIYGRVLQFAKLYLYSPSSGFYFCPLAMTDGATKLLHHLLTNSQSSLPPKSVEFMKLTYSRLISTDPNKFWTSGQWMTERAGGSDVGDGCMTLARLQPNGIYALSGFKWFTSATDAHVTITLARIVQPDGTYIKGSQGISCFLMRVKNDDGTLNHIKIGRLKNKLGTKQLPTAELELCGSIAYLISQPGRGISCITTLINITRIYNSIGACSGMRRMIALCRDYQHRRVAFGKPLSKHSLHSETLADMEISYRASLLLTYDLIHKLSLSEYSQSTKQDELLLRLFIPIAKLYTAKLNVAVASEGLECFGGAGYVEDTKLPRLLRDAQVLPIWEGTTNVLSFDVLRVLNGTKGECFTVLDKTISSTLSTARTSHPQYNPLYDTIVTSMNHIKTFLVTAQSSLSRELLESRARDLSYALGKIYICHLMIQHALWSNSPTDWGVLERYMITQELVPFTLVKGVTLSSDISRRLALDVDPSTGASRGCGDVDHVSGHIRTPL